MGGCWTPGVVWWAAQECEWQQSGPLSVSWMLTGREAVLGWDDELTVARVQHLGGLVEPRHNPGDAWRRVDVRVGPSVKMPYENVPAAMAELVTGSYLAWDHDDNADEWFRQYEDIHPFRDGNGRTGNILWNWLRGTLEEPEMPPNLWDDPRRYAGPVPSPEEG